ncbi:MAG TPA: hypothetical protein VFF90_07715 [Saprospiraceae bacterium]|nr:hypothetical protein [Saprospiraceae bacterium]
MRILFLSCLIFLAYGGYSQMMGVTDTGDKVVLYSDGRWVYAERDTVREEEIPTNSKAFKKSKDADFLLKSQRTETGFWLDPKTWTFTTPESDAAAEYELDHENGSLYGLVITENLDLSLTALANIALQNAREAAPDIKVTDKEYRMVNGKKVLMMRMVGTIQEIRFSYFGYYYTAPGVSVQYLVYTSETFMEENLTAVEELLNGFVDLAK